MLAYTTKSGDVVQLNVKNNETSVIIDNTTLVNIVEVIVFSVDIEKVCVYLNYCQDGTVPVHNNGRTT